MPAMVARGQGRAHPIFPALNSSGNTEAVKCGINSRDPLGDREDYFCREDF
jgi:hypothetical protein